MYYLLFFLMIILISDSSNCFNILTLIYESFSLQKVYCIQIHKKSHV